MKVFKPTSKDELEREIEHAINKHGPNANLELY
jgi:hypothetical protein